MVKPGKTLNSSAEIIFCNAYRYSLSLEDFLIQLKALD